MGVTLLFPGQGSQYVGMGKSLEDKNIFQIADQTLGLSLSTLCFEGPEAELNLTKNTQPAIVTHSIGLFQKLKQYLDKNNIKIDRVLGHSVGEYAALVAAGALRAEDAIKAVHYRGQYMQEAVPAGEGAMYAILRVPGDIIAKACQQVSTSESVVMPANFNEPSQTVISGHTEACQKAVDWLKTNYEGKQMAIPLKVSAPFHSSLMKPAEQKLAEHLKTLEFKSNDIEYIANINAKKYDAGTRGDLIRNNLIEQVCGSVRWTDSISSLPSDTIFIEVGPGSVLKGLNKKINKDLRTYNLDSEAGFEGLKEFLS